MWGNCWCWMVFHVRSSCTSIKRLNLVHKKFVDIFDINVLQFTILQLLSLSNQRIVAIYHRACTKVGCRIGKAYITFTHVNYAYETFGVIYNILEVSWCNAFDYINFDTYSSLCMKMSNRFMFVVLWWNLFCRLVFPVMYWLCLQASQTRYM
jgi:hypothetical protein